MFTRDVGTKFQRGDIRDYPMPVWRQIEKNEGVELKKFSSPVADLAQAEMTRPKRGRPRKDVSTS